MKTSSPVNTTVRICALALFLLHIPAFAMAGSLAYDNLCASPPGMEAAMIVGLITVLVGAKCKTVRDGMTIMVYAAVAAAAVALVAVHLPAVAFLYALAYDCIPEDLQPTGPGSTIVLFSVMASVVFINMGISQRFEFMEYSEQEESLPETAAPAWPFVAAPHDHTLAAAAKGSPTPKRTPLQQVSRRLKNTYSRSILGPRSGNPVYQQWFY